MSEFQYYEFQAIDRALTAADKKHVQSLSSRGKVTKDRAVFSYSYSDFRNKPIDLLDRCFDIMLYVANFGVRRLIIRLPKELVEPEQFAPYVVEGGLTVTTTQKSVILDINLCCEDYYDWIDEDNGWLDGLVELRQEILSGDWRSLYLAWLQTAFSENAYGSMEQLEPPIPPNLAKHTPALKNFAEFFKVDDDIVAAAAVESASLKRQKKSEPIADWIATLPEAERNAYLLRVVQGETQVGTELLQYLRQQHGDNSKQPQGFTPGTRTLAELLELGQQRATERDKVEKAAARKERDRYLMEEVAPKARMLWQRVDDLVAKKQVKAYDEAILHLVDLQALAKRNKKLPEFTTRVQGLRDRYSTLRGFRDRLIRAHLLSN